MRRERRHGKGRTGQKEKKGWEERKGRYDRNRGEESKRM